MTEHASVGEIDVTFGVNGWVQARITRGESVQRQASSARQLAAMFRELQLMDAEAEELAARVWRRRPDDFSLPSAHGHESARRATGLPAIVVIVGLVGLVALLFYLVVDLAGG